MIWKTLRAAIDRSENDMEFCEATMGIQFPQEIAFPMLLKLLPDAYPEYLQCKHTVGQHDFR